MASLKSWIVLAVKIRFVYSPSEPKGLKRYDNDKDLKVCFLVMCVQWRFHVYCVLSVQGVDSINLMKLEMTFSQLVNLGKEP